MISPAKMLIKRSVLQQVLPALIVVSRGNIGTNGVCNIIDGHGLEPDPARAGERGIKQTFSAQQLVFQSGHLLDVHGHSWLKARHIAGIHNDLLPGF